MQEFSKKLTKTDIDVRLSFPMKVLNAFEFPKGKDEVEFEVTDSTGKSWTFDLSKRNKARHPHPKPILSSDWRAYSQAKGLKMNEGSFSTTRKTKPRNLKSQIALENHGHLIFPKETKLATPTLSRFSLQIDVHMFKQRV
ncbi:hypothetical protein CRYUN_Cryun10bG0126700 [Craigia yunnanensis]